MGGQPSSSTGLTAIRESSRGSERPSDSSHKTSVEDEGPAGGIQAGFLPVRLVRRWSQSSAPAPVSKKLLSNSRKKSLTPATKNSTHSHHPSEPKQG
jgi:hypothetical protein